MGVGSDRLENVVSGQASFRHHVRGRLVLEKTECRTNRNYL